MLMTFDLGACGQQRGGLAIDSVSLELSGEVLLHPSVRCELRQEGSPPQLLEAHVTHPVTLSSSAFVVALSDRAGTIEVREAPQEPPKAAENQAGKST